MFFTGYPSCSAQEYYPAQQAASDAQPLCGSDPQPAFTDFSALQQACSEPEQATQSPAQSEVSITADYCYKFPALQEACSEPVQATSTPAQSEASNNKENAVAAPTVCNKRNRTVYTKIQLAGLESYYQTNNLPSADEKAQIRATLGIKNEDSVDTWFKNKRAGDKRINKSVLTSEVKMNNAGHLQNKTRRPRQTINREQLAFLLEKFAAKAHPVAHAVEEMSLEIGLDQRVIKNWFKNKRANNKKNKIPW